MNMYVLGGCFMHRVHLINTVTGDPIPGQERGFGFLSREADYGVQPDYGMCTWYTSKEYEDIFDGWMKMGRFFAFVSAILAAVCFLVLLCTCCVAFSPSTFERWLLWMYIVAAISVAFSFFIFGSENCSANQCKVADGSGYAITAFMLHLVAANTVKSFNPPSAPPARRRGGDDADEIEEELDDLYYEDEDDKYPPFHPDGPRGVTVKKNGERVYNDGEDYYDDLGRMIDPNDDKGAYQQTKQAEDEESLNSADLDDISDGDLEDYASDNDEESPRQEYDEDGNPIFDPDSAEEHGNLGVGYEDEEAQYDEFDNPIDLHLVEEVQPQFDEYNNATEPRMEYGEPDDPVDQYDYNGNVDTESVPISPAHYNEYDQQYNDAALRDAPTGFSGDIDPLAQERRRDPPENDDDDDEGPVFA